MRRSWDRQACIEEQLEELREHGVQFEAPDPIPEQGKIKVKVRWAMGEDEHDLEVIFGDLYPYFPPTVNAPDWRLPRHQNPLAKNLCLLGRESEFHPRSDTLYRFLSERVGTLVETATAQDTSRVSDLEDHQAEPITAFYPYQPGMLVIDGAWDIPPDQVRGELILGAANDRLPQGRLVVKRVLGSGGQVLAALDEELAAGFPVERRGRWGRLPEHVPSADPEEHFQRLDALGHGRAPWNRGQDSDGQAVSQSFYVAIAPEESGWRTTTELGWLGLSKVKRRGDRATPVFLRVGRSGRTDLSQRVPELQGLPSKRVLMVGLGSIGAPIALGLAQAGVGELHLVDGDFVEPATAVRWPFGLPVAGGQKEEVLSSFIQSHFPFTRAKPVQVGMRLDGAASSADAEDFLERAEGADLLVDATADWTVQYFTSSVAKGFNVPYLGVSGTLGGWGGSLIRIGPKTQGCWSCARDFLVSEDKEPSAAPSDARIQPQGCADRTFTAAGVDMSFIGLCATRAALESLAERYPQPKWDIQTIALRGPAGEPALPLVKGYNLTRRPECPFCEWCDQRSG